MATKADLLDIIRRLRSAVTAEASGGEGMADAEIYQAIADADRALGRKPPPALPEIKGQSMFSVINAKPQRFVPPS